MKKENGSRYTYAKKAYPKQGTRKSSQRRKRKTRRFLSRLFLYSVILLLIITAFFLGGNKIIERLKGNTHISTASQGLQNNSYSYADSVGTGNTLPAGSSKDDSWMLVLVNDTHPLNSDFAPVTQTLSNGLKVDERIYEPLMAMLNAGQKEGLSFVVCSAYRPYSQQTELFNEKLSILTNEGYSDTEAYNNAKMEIAAPGTSEHQLGLAVDIVSKDYQLLDDQQAETPEYQWLEANCHKYGFIVRYPIDKTDITGIIYEPWHFRYVGTETAEQIMSQGICFEEYFQE